MGLYDMLTRRGLLTGLLASPAVIRLPGLLMPVKPWIVPPRSSLVIPKGAILMRAMWIDHGDVLGLSYVYEGRMHLCRVSGMVAENNIWDDPSLRPAIRLANASSNPRVGAGVDESAKIPAGASIVDARKRPARSGERA